MKRTLLKTPLIALILLASLLLTPAAPVWGQKIIIKVGAIIPLRSPWMAELKKLNAEWMKITNNLVEIKIYAGGAVGTEEDMVRKIRTGMLGGAVFTNFGMNHIYPDSFVMGIPFYLRTDDEVKYIIDKMKPAFEIEFEKKDFKVITWSRAGWVNFFSKHKVITPEDLKKHKLSFSTDTPVMELAWKKAGFHVVPNELKDLMMGLQSGMVEAFYLPPLVAGSGQYFPLAPNMCSVNVAPIIGGFVISKKLWDKIPEQYRQQLLKVANDMSDRLFIETIKLEKEALTEMKKNGLIINQMPPEIFPQWKAMSDQGLSELLGKAFSKEVFAEMQKHVEEYRKLHGTKASN